jgi:hypothetical protein
MSAGGRCATHRWSGASADTYGKEILVAVWQCVPVTLLIVAIIGGMYFGVVTPTEAAGFGCVVALALGAFYRELTWKKFETALLTSVAVSSVVMLIIVAGQILNFTVVQAGIGREMAKYLATQDLAPFVFFTALFVLYLVLGTFLDGISMMMLTCPRALSHAEDDGVLGGVVRRDPRDPGGAGAVVPPDRVESLRSAVDREGRLAVDDCVGLAALCRHALRAVVSALFLPKPRVVAGRGNERVIEAMEIIDFRSDFLTHATKAMHEAAHVAATRAISGCARIHGSGSSKRAFPTCSARKTRSSFRLARWPIRSASC